jgi:hypothetical protein
MEPSKVSFMWVYSLRFRTAAWRCSKATPQDSLQEMPQKLLFTRNAKGPDTGHLWAPGDSQSVISETLNQKSLQSHFGQVPVQGGDRAEAKNFKQAVKWFFSTFNSCEMFTNKNINHPLKTSCQQYLEEKRWSSIAGVSWMQMLDNAVERGLLPGRRNFRNLLPDWIWAGLAAVVGRGDE